MKLSKKSIFVVLVVAVVAGLAVLFFRTDSEKPPVNSQKSPEETAPTADPSQPSGFDKTKYPLDQPDSLWLVVNKQRGIPTDYVPEDLIVPAVRLRLASSEQQMQFRQVAHTDLLSMFKAAADKGVSLVFGSGYRSAALQKQFYDGYVAADGQAAADRYSARPGHSEHQTGLSFDATTPDQSCHLDACFADTPQGKWLAANAHKYGFHLRYQKDKEAITGYSYEPWHYRYVGKELAEELFKTGQTLEEFFNLQSN